MNVIDVLISVALVNLIDNLVLNVLSCSYNTFFSHIYFWNKFNLVFKQH